MSDAKRVVWQGELENGIRLRALSDLTVECMEPSGEWAQVTGLAGKGATAMLVRKLVEELRARTEERPEDAHLCFAHAAYGPEGDCFVCDLEDRSRFEKGFELATEALNRIRGRSLGFAEAVAARALKQISLETGLEVDWQEAERQSRAYWSETPDPTDHPRCGRNWSPHEKVGSSEATRRFRIFGSNPPASAVTFGTVQGDHVAITKDGEIYSREIVDGTGIPRWIPVTGLTAEGWRDAVTLLAKRLHDAIEWSRAQKREEESGGLGRWHYTEDSEPPEPGWYLAAVTDGDMPCVREMFWTETHWDVESYYRVYAWTETVQPPRQRGGGLSSEGDGGGPADKTEFLPDCDPADLRAIRQILEIWWREWQEENVRRRQER